MDAPPPHLDPEIAALVSDALRASARRATAGQMRDDFDAPLGGMIDSALAETGSDEGTLWAADREREEPALVPIHHYQPGSDTSDFLNAVSQPLGDGLISMVFAGGNSLCENDIANEPAHSKTVDAITGRPTSAMIVTPVYASSVVIAVLTGVRIAPVQADSDVIDAENAYSLEDLAILQSAARTVGEVMEFRWLASLCDW